MNINRHNYEEFFLLYVDNELSAAERNAVEVFVQQNPDLQKELQMLQQSLLSCDDIVFENKNELLKENGISALQEKLLLFVDDELPADKINEIKKLIATNEAISVEWNILKQIKLQPDKGIVFKNKKSLYRTEGRGIITIKWWRVAAAAVLLGVGIWTGISFYKTSNAVSKTNQTVAKDKKTSSPIIKNEEVNPVVSNQKKNLPEQLPDTHLNQNKNEQKNIIAVKDKNPNNKKPDNDLPKPIENINNNISNKNLLVNVQPLETPQNNVVTKNSIVTNEIKKPDNAATNENNVYAKPAVYNANTEETTDTKILYLDEEKIKRTKFGGFIRKLKRVVERNTNGITVAGFEIPGK